MNSPLKTSIGEVTEAQLIDHLTYCSFKANRGYGMSAEAYGRLLNIDTTAYEARYQRETHNYKEKVSSATQS